MKAGSWASIGLIYLYGVAAAAEISRMVPLQADLARVLGASPADFALMISLLTVPAAVLSTVAGGLIDRIGARQGLIISCAIGAAANFCYLFANSVIAFDVIRVFEGLSLVGIFAGAPALIMATTSGRRRFSAMAVWSTYTPVGFSAGLVIGSTFAGTSNWRLGFLIHGAIFIICAAAAFLLPRSEEGGERPRVSLATAVSEILSSYTQMGPLRVSLTFGLMAFVGLGTSTVFPSLFAGSHGISLAKASNILAIANAMNVVGGLGVGLLLARGLPIRMLFVILALIGSLTGTALYVPGTTSEFGIVALCIWLMVSGAGAAAVLAVLPAVVASPERGAAAAGLVSQVGAATSFITPVIFLTVEASGHWILLVGLVVLAWVGSIFLIPTIRHGTEAEITPTAA